VRIVNSYLGYIILGLMFGAFHLTKYIDVQWLNKMIKILLALGFAFIIIMQSLVLSQVFSTVPKDKDMDYLIVLGAGLKGDRVSYTLAYRLDAAYDYLISHDNCKVIVSGGQGPDEWVSEALAMKTYLVSKGIDENRIIMENQSTSTEENIIFSKQFIEDNWSMAIVTSNYHMYRAKYIAKPHLNNVEGISAYSPRWLLVNYMVRESITIVNEWRKVLL
jgi:uncharacterized SAM-binding protein YcdF (DUF218 family)